MASSAEAEVLHEFRGAVRAAVLNRPRALNALSLPMIEQLHGVYAAWDAAPGVAAILLKGAGGKAFCAGGDVKAVALAGRAGDAAGALRFFRAEYRLNYLIARLSKPHVALLDGITMGGGAGVSVHGAFRVATERTLFAMPECAIGLFPDVGGSYFLPRLLGGLGLYLGLTGARLSVRVAAVWMAAFAHRRGAALGCSLHRFDPWLQGVDVLHAGLATHFIRSALLPDVEAAIAALGAAAADEAALRRTLNQFAGRAPLPAGQLRGRMADIDAAFCGKGSVEEVYAACEAAGAGWGADTTALMAK